MIRVPLSTMSLQVINSFLNISEVVYTCIVPATCFDSSGGCLEDGVGASELSDLIKCHCLWVCGVAFIIHIVFEWII